VVCPAILGLPAEQLKDLSLLGLDFSLKVHEELDAHCPRQGKVYGVVLHPFRRSFRNRMAFRFEMGHAHSRDGHRCWWVCSALFP
jgi:hypothetical protein